MTPEQIAEAAANFKEIAALSGGKRCGIQWTPWMGDWFTSWSPRNSNNNAEGPWDHWIDLACKILRAPMTAIVRPEAHQAAKADAFAPKDFYDETSRDLTDDELAARFAGRASRDRA